ncbi:MAG: class I SAM-dependent methyltransferase [Vicinamibacterales bacterium]
MSGFSAEWLALREPHDHAARSTVELPAAFREALRRVGRVSVLDLACGTGSNLRFLAPRLGGDQRWVLVDHDARLLACVRSTIDAWASRENVRVESTTQGFRLDASAWRCDVELRQADLGSAEAVALVDGRHLVTASALLDLVSASWLERLVERCVASRAAVHFALSYDGRVAFWPVDPTDDRVRSALNAHQRRDKGFGPALGPEASAAAATACERGGYAVDRLRTDWVVDADAAAFQRALVDGWASAAAETTVVDAGEVQSWHLRRAALVARGESRLTVGHEDLFAWP